MVTGNNLFGKKMFSIEARASEKSPKYLSAGQQIVRVPSWWLQEIKGPNFLISTAT